MADNKELLFLIHQFLTELDRQKYRETLRMLEKESGVFLDINYLKERVNNGDWEEVEKYLSGFTKLEDNPYSRKIFFEIRKQKYYEALDKHGGEKAVDILIRDLKVFSNYDANIYSDFASLLTLNNLREHVRLSQRGDENIEREKLGDRLNELIDKNPLLHEKLQFPVFQRSRLKVLINQSLTWQLQHCVAKGHNHGTSTLFVDHSCEQGAAVSAPSPVANPLMGSARSPFQPGGASIISSVAGQTVNDASSVPHQAASGGPMGLSPPISTMKRQRSPTKNPTLVNQTGSPQPILKRPRSFWVPAESGGVLNMSYAEAKTSDELRKSKILKLKDIKEQTQLRTLRLPDNKIARLIYTNSGHSILSLGYDGVHKLWSWKEDEHNLNGKATTKVPLKLWHPSGGISLKTRIRETELEEAIPCLALSNNGHYAVSASGDKISVYNLMNSKEMTSFMSPPPAATCLAFFPWDNNLIAIGMEDSVIKIYDCRTDQVKWECRGHQKRVTGIVFSKILNVMVSSGADAQIRVWSRNGSEQLANKFLEVPSGRAQNPPSQIRLQLHQNQNDVLVIHKMLIAVYKASNLDLISQWVTRESSNAITDATYSCDGQLIYASFVDGSICVFNSAPLNLRCQINPTSYFPCHPSSGLHPLAIAAHPSQSNQFAVGLTDGGVHVLKPLESEGKWDAKHPDDDDPG